MVVIKQEDEGALSIDFTPSDKALGTELEVTAGYVICQAINTAINAILNTSDTAESYSGDFVTPKWKEKFLKDRFSK